MFGTACYLEYGLGVWGLGSRNVGWSFWVSRKWRLGWGIDRLKEQLSQLSLSLFSNHTLLPKALNPTPQP